jgi:hypothetical protein
MRWKGKGVCYGMVRYGNTGWVLLSAKMGGFDSEISILLQHLLSYHIIAQHSTA